MSGITEIRPIWLWFWISAILIMGGGFLAHMIQTSGGVKIRDIRYMGTDGKVISALLYIPDNATKDTPAPGIVATHGYINSKETQDGFAIEFARRGYVVLAPDQPGHGYSDPPAFNAGFGGPGNLAYLRSLDIVDPNNIGLEGHSMGGWASVRAAAFNPNGYQAMVLASSSTGSFGSPAGTPEFPWNLALIFSEFDEFSETMWGAKIPKNIVDTNKLKTLFGTDSRVEAGKLYGSIEDGTARKLYQPSMIHPRVHFSIEAISYAVEWMQTTLKGGKSIPPTDQIWYWKEVGTLVALIGMVLLFFTVGSLLLHSDFFKELAESPPEGRSITSATGWWIGALITILMPIPLYLWAWSFNGRGIAKSRFLIPQQITNTIMFWALGVGVISLVLFLLWHYASNRKKGGTLVHYGLAWRYGGIRWKKVGKSILLAALVALGAYLSLVLSDWLFQTDYRIWVFAIKPMSPLHLRIFFCYLIPFTVYFLIAGLILHGQLRPFQADGSPMAMGKEMLINVLLMISGYVLYLLFQYIPLFAGHTLSIPSESLSSIVLFQFIPLFIIVSLVSTYFFRKTGHLFVGSFLNAFWVTWTVVAGQAIHYSPR